MEVFISVPPDHADEVTMYLNTDNHTKLSYFVRHVMNGSGARLRKNQSVRETKNLSAYKDMWFLGYF